MRNDVAIYAPFAAGVYSREHLRSGGAERQTNLLARSLSEEGLRVAHIIYRVDNPLPVPNPNYSLVMRPHHAAGLGGAREIGHVWRSLAHADAAVYVYRTGSPMLGVVAAFCQLHRRALVFAGSTDADFTLRTLNDGPSRAHRTLLYRAGLRRADAVVVQTSGQLQVARTSFAKLSRLMHIPSFAEPLAPAPRPGKQFVWIGRTTDYKRPLLTANLAEAVPEAKFLMVLVEDQHPEAMHAELERRAARLPNLELSEALPHAEITQLIGDAVAVVNTSVTEGMPNVFLEGWARGVPALTLDCDPDGLIAERGMGIAAGGSWERFVEGARTLWAQRDSESEPFRASRAYIEQVHGIHAVTSRWLEVVREIADTRRRIPTRTADPVPDERPAVSDERPVSDALHARADG